MEMNWKLFERETLQLESIKDPGSTLMENSITPV